MPKPSDKLNEILSNTNFLHEYMGQTIMTSVRDSHKEHHVLYVQLTLGIKVKHKQEYTSPVRCG